MLSATKLQIIMNYNAKQKTRPCAFLQLIQQVKYSRTMRNT